METVRGLVSSRQYRFQCQCCYRRRYLAMAGGWAEVTVEGWAVGQVVAVVVAGVPLADRVEVEVEAEALGLVADLGLESERGLSLCSSQSRLRKSCPL